MRFAVILPVYNEEATLEKVLDKVSHYYKEADLVVVDDGSVDRTPEILKGLPVKAVIRHPRNLGYGQTLIDGFRYVIEQGYDWCVTMDADDQHEPAYIHCLLEKLDQFDIVSGSRYLDPLMPGDHPPADRLEVNRLVTEKLRQLTGFPLTDSFCGFKGYRVEALKKLQLTETNYGFPLQVWMQAARHGLKVTECAVPLIYLDPKRNFNNQFTGQDERLQHYFAVLEREKESWEAARRPS
ncbi:MAG TPA: glycosyltransferase family 2 protein [bacterium]|nr:glycosyltransferase family 2 protein [bacterium]